MVRFYLLVVVAAVSAGCAKTNMIDRRAEDYRRVTVMAEDRAGVVVLADGATAEGRGFRVSEDVISWRDAPDELHWAPTYRVQSVSVVHRGHGALLGAGVGIVVGGALGALAGGTCSSDCADNAALRGAGIYAGLGGALGVAAGTLLGFRHRFQFSTVAAPPRPLVAPSGESGAPDGGVRGGPPRR